MLSHISDTFKSIAAASFYIASHIPNQPRRITEAAHLAGISERTIYSVYGAIHYKLYNFVDEDWCEIVSGTTLAEAAEALPSLTWPSLQQEFIDSEGEDEEHIELANNNRVFAISGFKLVKELCFDS